MNSAKRGMRMLATTMLLLAGGALLYILGAPQLGAAVQGGSSVRLQESENYRAGRFRNPVATTMGLSSDSTAGTIVDFIRGNPDRVPAGDLPTVPLRAESITGKEGMVVTWLGHSTCLIEIDGKVVLTDPIFSDRASPVRFLGPRRFGAEPPISLENLPALDAVVISHDHYDHLDYRSIRALREKTRRFYVPLGVGDHLRRWGVEHRQIVELDWWEEKRDGPLTFAATPARHFSGRGLGDRSRTLWASWVIAGRENRVFFGGDSGYFSGYRQIGEVYGPFDVTMLESGAYNDAWADIHMKPEETVRAHLDLGGEVLLPIHWGKFNLALHPWTEPIERLLAAAEEEGVTAVAPLQGERISQLRPPEVVRWWEEVSGSALTAE